jgi:hypothetical protein
MFILPSNNRERKSEDGECAMFRHCLQDYMAMSHQIEPSAQITATANLAALGIVRYGNTVSPIK